jgi:hypothetical protein
VVFTLHKLKHSDQAAYGFKKRLEGILEDEVARSERHRAQASRFASRRLERLLGRYLRGHIDWETLRVRKEKIEAETRELEYAWPSRPPSCPGAGPSPSP